MKKLSLFLLMFISYPLFAEESETDSLKLFETGFFRLDEIFSHRYLNMDQTNETLRENNFPYFTGGSFESGFGFYFKPSFYHRDSISGFRRFFLEQTYWGAYLPVLKFFGRNDSNDETKFVSFNHFDFDLMYCMEFPLSNWLTLNCDLGFNFYISDLTLTVDSSIRHGFDMGKFLNDSISSESFHNNGLWPFIGIGLEAKIKSQSEFVASTDCEMVYEEKNLIVGLKFKFYPGEPFHENFWVSEKGYVSYDFESTHAQGWRLEFTFGAQFVTRVYKK